MTSDDPTTSSTEETESESATGSADVLERLSDKLSDALDDLAGAKAFAKSTYQTQVFQLAEALMGRPGGVEVLFSHAHRFDEVGVFHGGPWVDASKLQPPLVEGSLVASGVYPVVETLSELRVLAIATGRVKSQAMTPSEATRFLDEVMALNLRFLFPGETEQDRIEIEPHRDSNIALFRLLASKLSLGRLLGEVTAEIEEICAQRPIMTSRVRSMIRFGSKIPTDGPGADPAAAERLQVFLRAIAGPSPLAQQHPTARAYRKAVREADMDVLANEAAAMGASMRQTGLVSDHHAVLVRRLVLKAPDLCGRCLDLTPVGQASLEQHIGVARQLVKVAIQPATSQAVYGFARLLDRGLLARPEIRAGLRRVVELDFDREARRKLLARKKKRDGLTANAMLLAGCIAMLGQPLGIGQGNNPTCQAARGLSMWSQFAPGYLLGLVVSAARDGFVQMDFQGLALRSDQIESGVATRIDPELDPVSLIVVPHLDRLYDAMMRQVALRPVDGHKWVNPALYGRWVPQGFASVFQDIAQTTVADFSDFIRRFYAAFHPLYNEGHRLMYPKPIGLLVTNGHGAYLGAHAVSLLRVREHAGVLRAYFYNPNNEGRQDWGQRIRPSVSGHGEREGESSLPFHEFASRIYAYHFNPFELGDGYAVPDSEIDEIEQLARNSWGKAFRWA